MTGLRSIPKDLIPRRAAVLVVVPLPFQGSKIMQVLGSVKDRRKLYANSSLYPA
jgi:hypothetical protein